MQVFIALLQHGSAFLQSLALRQQGPLVDKGADEVRQLAHGVLDAGNVQVAGEVVVQPCFEYHLVHLAGASGLGAEKRNRYFVGVRGLHKRQQEMQGRIAFERLE